MSHNIIALTAEQVAALRGTGQVVTDTTAADWTIRLEAAVTATSTTTAAAS